MSVLHNMTFKRKNQDETLKMESSLEGICNEDLGSDAGSRYPSETCEEFAETTDLIETPIPKNCSIVMNGHYKVNRAMELAEAQEGDEDEQEDKPFLKQKGTLIDETNDDNQGRYEKTVPFSKHSRGTILPTKGSSTEDSSCDSANESGAEGEPERQLLRDEDVQACSSPKCISTKNRLTALVSSPKKVSESRCHIQHRPLGRQSVSPAYNTPNSKYKWNWTVFKCMLSAFITFGVTIFVVTLSVVLLTNPTECKSERQWWEDVVSYEIFPASFQDTDNDGFGDFKGVINRLDYIKNLSVDVIRLNSIFSALDYPLEYEHVIDFTNVDPHLGRMADFKHLVDEVHARGLFLMLDINPTVTSDQHSWAAHWLLHRKGTYENFYVNVTDDKPEPPMESRDQDILDNSTKNEKASPHRTFGSHLFLNWSNPAVQFEMLQAMDFWLKAGVDGFYTKHLENLKVKDSRDIEPILKKWRDLLDEYGVNTTRRILASSLTTMESLQDRCGVSPTMMSFFDVVDAGLDFAPGKTLEVSDEIWRVRKWVSTFRSPPWIWWHFGSVETSRLASRIGKEYTMNSIFVLTLLPGSVSLFYGDEIALQDSYDAVTKKVFRGGQLSLMQWTSAPNANFTHDGVKPWLPIHPDLSKEDFEARSKVINVLKRLLYLKKSSLQQVTHNKISLDNLIGKIIGKMDPEKPNYRWSHDAQLNTLILEVAFGGKRRALLATNFGITDVKMSSIQGIEDFKWLVVGFHDLRLVFTSDNLQGHPITDWILRPGHALLCLYGS